MPTRYTSEGGVAIFADRALRCASLAFALAMCLAPVSAGVVGSGGGAVTPGAPQAPKVTASSAILIDARSGQVIYEKNADAVRPPASTTKIMTAILLREHLKLDEVLTASKHASEANGSSLYLKPGEKITVRDLMYAIMLRSANDGCVVVAERIAGSEPKFAEMMTKKAHEIGAVHTIYRNCNGLNTPPNETTARDLATMARYAAHDPVFNEVTKTRYHKVGRSIEKKDVIVRNHARFLWRFPGADGIKTGFTNPAGKCFVGSATFGGWRLISVVMNSPDIFGETAKLMRYGFGQFQRKLLVARGQQIARAEVCSGTAAVVPATVLDDLTCVVPRGVPASVNYQVHQESVNAPVAPGSTVGTVEVRVDGRKQFVAPLVAAAGVNRAGVFHTAGVAGGTYVLVAFMMMAVAYAATIAKSTRIRRDRLKAYLRGDYRRW